MNPVVVVGGGIVAACAAFELARIVSGATVAAVRDGEVVSTAGRHPASTVVVAAGAGTPALFLAVTVPAAPAFLIRVRAQEGLVRTVAATSAFEVREAAPGHLLATAPLGADRSRTGLRALAGQAVRASELCLAGRAAGSLFPRLAGLVCSDDAAGAA